MRARLNDHHESYADKTDAPDRQSPEGLMDLSVAADYLGINTASLYWLKRTRQVAHYVVNRKLRFQREDLDAYLERVRIPAADE